MLKRLLALVLLAACGAAALAVYRGSRLLDEARYIAAPEARLAVLEREQTVLPIHARIYEERARAYFDLGRERLADAEKSAAAFARCNENYLTALAVDPFNPFTHFDFAQALLYMDHLTLPFAPLPYFREFERAAGLASHEPRIYYEVSRVLLARWAALTPEEQAFALEVLKRAVARTDAEQLQAIFHLWELGAKDFQSVEKILPRDRTVYRQFARFLGERSLDRTARIRFLSQAESLDFQDARNEYAAGTNALQQFKLKEAESRLSRALASLTGIVFYQSLVPQALIDPLEYQALQKDILLGLAKCRIEETRSLEAAIPALRAYLALEDRTSAVSELERFLKERGFLQGKNATASKDFVQTSFGALMSFKQNRFRDIVDIGLSLEQSFLVVPEAMKPEYARILELVGDSYQKLDFIYESNKFYEKARSIGGDNLALLLKIRRNFERLNDADRIKAVNAELAKMLTPAEIRPASPALAKGGELVQDLMLDGGRAMLSLDFDPVAGEPKPLVSILLNGQIVWEDFFVEGPLVLRLSPNQGANTLKIIPVNQAVTIRSLSAVPEGQYAEPPAREGTKTPSGEAGKKPTKKTGEAALLKIKDIAKRNIPTSSTKEMN